MLPLRDANEFPKDCTASEDKDVESLSGDANREASGGNPAATGGKNRLSRPVLFTAALDWAGDFENELEVLAMVVRNSMDGG